MHRDLTYSWIGAATKLNKVALFLKYRALPGLNLNLGVANLRLDVVWLLVAPVAIWAIATIYVPIMEAGLAGFQPWEISVVILVLMLVSLAVHVLAHSATARVIRCPRPRQLVIYPLGDPAQVWPTGRSAGREALIALAGPAVQGILAIAAYTLWNLQLNAWVNLISFFMIFFNLGLLALNLIPVFPFDGGRLVRAIFWWLCGLPDKSARLAFRCGICFAMALIAWGAILIAQRDRLSPQTGATVLVTAGLIFLSLAFQRRTAENPVIKEEPAGSKLRGLRVGLAALLILPLALVTLSLLPLNGGLEAPGFTASVEPLIQMPSQYRHPSSGSLILTSVIPQAPILVGEWIYGHLDPSIKLESEDQIVPRSQTVQALSQQNFRMLLSSGTTAVIEGLRLAGYTVEIQSDGAEIISILPQSPAAGILQPGDVIIDMNGQPITSVTDLSSQLQTQEPGVILQLQIKRRGENLSLTVPTMPPAEPGAPVRLGISVETQETGYKLPFPVLIVPQKITGGPSAGLMFTLGVYDLVSGQDLTGGRKIAGTGTIDLNGKVGIIGGVQQKVVAAERAGAQYFLCPPDNYQDALAIAQHIQVIKVATAQQALDFLHSLPSLKQAKY